MALININEVDSLSHYWFGKLRQGLGHNS